MLRSTLVTVVLAVAAASSPTAQQPAAPAPPVFKSESDLVVLHVSVFDGDSDAIARLPQSAFTVYEEGKAQTITFFSDTDVPVAVGLVVDNSSSMLTRRSMVLAGSRAFGTSSHPEDELFTIIFNEHVRLGLQEGVDFTTSRPQLEASLLRYPPGGQTALYDAVIDALDHLQQASHQKRALIVLSDGLDNASRHSKADMLHRARRSDALIYTISTADDGYQRGDSRTLKDLAASTGGAAYFPKSEAATVDAFKEIAGNIRRGYSIGYVPSERGADGEYRRVKVLVRVDGRNLRVRARDGYTAGDDSFTR